VTVDNTVERLSEKLRRPPPVFNTGIYVYRSILTLPTRLMPACQVCRLGSDTGMVGSANGG